MKLQLPPQLYSQVHHAAKRIPRSRRCSELGIEIFPWRFFFFFGGGAGVKKIVCGLWFTIANHTYMNLLTRKNIFFNPHLIKFSPKEQDLHGANHHLHETSNSDCSRWRAGPRESFVLKEPLTVAESRPLVTWLAVQIDSCYRKSQQLPWITPITDQKG